jgi:hypothetical protein
MYLIIGGRKGIYMRSKYFYSILTAVFILVYLPVSGSCTDTWNADRPVIQDLNAIWGSTDSDMYAAGASNTMIHYDGTSWVQESQFSTFTPIIDLMSLWGIPYIQAQSQVFRVLCTGKQGMIFKNDGMGWGKFALPGLTAVDINALWGSSATNLYAVGSLGKILHFNGSWNLVTPDLTSLDLYCVWGSSANNIFVGGELGSLFRYNGLTWQSVDLSSLTSQDLLAIWGSSGSDVYAAGSDGDILHFDGLKWKTVATSSGVRLNTLWGSAADDVFAAGGNGKILHYYDDGVPLGWHDVTPTGILPQDINDIKSIWGSSSGKVYFACKTGQILTLSRPDHIPPVIYYSELHKDNDGYVYWKEPVSFHFSEKMKDSSINNSTVILKSGSTPVQGNISLSSDKTTISVSGDLAWSTAYTVTVTSDGVTDLAGNALKSDYSVSFTIEPKPTEVPGTGNGGSGCFISSARL